MLVRGAFGTAAGAAPPRRPAAEIIDVVAGGQGPRQGPWTCPIPLRAMGAARIRPTGGLIQGCVAGRVERPGNGRSNPAAEAARPSGPVLGMAGDTITQTEHPPRRRLPFRNRRWRAPTETPSRKTADKFLGMLDLPILPGRNGEETEQKKREGSRRSRREPGREKARRAISSRRCRPAPSRSDGRIPS